MSGAPDLSVLNVAQACERLGGISRATFYRLPYFRTRRILLSPGRVGILAADVDRYIVQQSQRTITRRAS